MQDFLFYKIRPWKIMCKITIAHGTSCAYLIFKICPLNLKIKSLFIIFKQRIHALNIIYARGKPRAKHYFSHMRHVQEAVA
jgi:hypothetical protein